MSEKTKNIIDNYDALSMDALKNEWNTLSEDEKNILGRPNFSCGAIANHMRKGGFNVAEKAEEEQALVIWTMLEFYKVHKKEWCIKLAEFLKTIKPITSQ